MILGPVDTRVINLIFSTLEVDLFSLLQRFLDLLQIIIKKLIYKETIHISQMTSDIVEDYLYKPSLKVVDFLTTKILKINYGKIQLHISYIFISVIIALVLVLKFV